jgi:hypothetical protein
MLKLFMNIFGQFLSSKLIKYVFHVDVCDFFELVAILNRLCNIILVVKVIYYPFHIIHLNYILLVQL